MYNKKDNIWFPFGSMCGAWGQSHSTKPCTIEEFMSAMRSIYDLANDFVAEPTNSENTLPNPPYGAGEQNKESQTLNLPTKDDA